jgi:small subunit ribosomal protein S7
MPRRRAVPVRPAIPDSKYNSAVLAKFIKRMMVDGKKSISISCVYSAMDIIKEKNRK